LEVVEDISWVGYVGFSVVVRWLKRSCLHLKHQFIDQNEVNELESVATYLALQAPFMTQALRHGALLIGLHLSEVGDPVPNVVQCVRARRCKLTRNGD
jgi:hypothetical protein